MKKSAVMLQIVITQYTNTILFIVSQQDCTIWLKDNNICFSMTKTTKFCGWTHRFIPVMDTTPKTSGFWVIDATRKKTYSVIKCANNIDFDSMK